MRRRWLIPLILLALAVIAFLILRALLQPERLSAFLLRQAEQATGLELALDSPADIGLFPDLHIELDGLRAQAPGAEQPLLRVARVEAALPWSSLRGGDITLLGLRLRSPQLDLPATLEFFARDTDAGPPPPLRLPQLDAPLEIRDGRINAEGWSLQALDLTLPSLHEGRPTRLSLRGRVQLEQGSHTLALELATTPRADGDQLHLSPLTLDLVIDALPAWRPHVEGELRWNPAGLLTFDLRSLIAPWPDDWPPLPLPPADDDAVALALRYDGDSALSGRLDFSLLRGEDGLRGQATLNQTLAWLGSGRDSPLPPAQADIDIPRLEYGPVQASGIRIRLDPAEEASADPP